MPIQQQRLTMELDLHFQVALLVLAFFIVYGILFKSTNHRRLPPSPPLSLPVIGHLHLLGKLPHHSLSKLAQKHGGLMCLKLGTVNALVASSPDAARELLKTHDLVFASRPDTATAEFGYKGFDVLWAPYGDYWRNMRKLCTLELLTAKRIKMFQAVRKFEMSVLLSELLNSSKERLIVNLSTQVYDLTFNLMSRMIMNRSYSGGGSSPEREEARAFKDTITELFTLASTTNIGDFIPYLKWMDRQIPRIKTVMRDMDEFLQKEIDKHHKNWKHGQVPNDFMDVMLSVSSDMGLSDMSMKALALDMIAAGTDTSAVTVEWAVAELLRHPELLEKAKQELKEVIGAYRTLEESDIPKLDYLQAVVKETLRLHPPGPLLQHESTEVCKVRDYIIPAKTRAIVNIYAIGRDASAWEDPLTFNPDRFLGGNAIDVRGNNFELLPFGSGRRMCPGQMLGVTTVHLILGSLLHAFEWHMPDGFRAEDLDMDEKFGLTIPRANPLKLVPSARLSAEAYQKVEVQVEETKV